jgi:hypothetical protein
MNMRISNLEHGDFLIPFFHYPAIFCFIFSHFFTLFSLIYSFFFELPFSFESPSIFHLSALSLSHSFSLLSHLPFLSHIHSSLNLTSITSAAAPVPIPFPQRVYWKMHLRGALAVAEVVAGAAFEM